MVKTAPLADRSTSSPTPTQNIGRTVSGTRTAVRQPPANADAAPTPPRAPGARRALDASKETNPMGTDELRALRFRCAANEKARAVEAQNVAPPPLPALVDDADVHEADTVFFAIPPAEPDHVFAEVDSLLSVAPPPEPTVVHAPPALVDAPPALVDAPTHAVIDAPPQRSEMLRVASTRGYWPRRLLALALLAGMLVVLHADAAPVIGVAPAPARTLAP